MSASGHYTYTAPGHRRVSSEASRPAAGSGTSSNSTSAGASSGVIAPTKLDTITGVSSTKRDSLTGSISSITILPIPTSPSDLAHTPTSPLSAPPSSSSTASAASFVSSSTLSKGPSSTLSSSSSLSTSQSHKISSPNASPHISPSISPQSGVSKGNPAILPVATLPVPATSNIMNAGLALNGQQQGVKTASFLNPILMMPPTNITNNILNSMNAGSSANVNNAKSAPSTTTTTPHSTSPIPPAASLQLLPSSSVPSSTSTSSSYSSSGPHHHPHSASTSMRSISTSNLSAGSGGKKSYHANTLDHPATISTASSSSSSSPTSDAHPTSPPVFVTGVRSCNSSLTKPKASPSSSTSSSPKLRAAASATQPIHTILPIPTALNTNSMTKVSPGGSPASTPRESSHTSHSNIVSPSSSANASSSSSNLISPTAAQSSSHSSSHPSLHTLPCAFSPSTFSLTASLTLIQYDTPQISQRLEQIESELLQTRSSMIVLSRRNFMLEKELTDMDEKIKLLIKNRITIQEVMQAATSASNANSSSSNSSTTGGVSLTTAQSSSAHNLHSSSSTSLHSHAHPHHSQQHQQHLLEIEQQKKQRSLYESLFYLLQSTPRYFALLSRLIPPSSHDSVTMFVQTVVFDTFGDAFDTYEERLLLSLFREALKNEIAECSDRTTLLRSNTPITQMLSAYAKRGSGLGILREILEEPLRNLCDSKQTRNVNLELQPLKIYHQLIADYEQETGKQSTTLRKDMNSDTEAMKNEQVQICIIQRVTKLVDICEKILQRILENAQKIPYGMRWICRVLGELYKNKFGGMNGGEDSMNTNTAASSTNTTTTTSIEEDENEGDEDGDNDESDSSSSSIPTSIESQIQALQGGFIYLRFINPVIVSPESINFVHTKPNRIMRRNLVLIAKILQNLSNGILFGEKEAYMKPMNLWLSQRLSKMKQYFIDLTSSVEDLDDTLSLDKYIGAGMRSAATHHSEITMSLNQIYFMYSIVQEYKSKICVDEKGQYTMNDPLAQLLEKFSSLPPVPIPDLKNVNNNSQTITLRMIDQYRDTRMSTTAMLFGNTHSAHGGGHSSSSISSLSSLSQQYQSQSLLQQSKQSKDTQLHPLYLQAKTLLINVIKRLAQVPSSGKDGGIEKTTVLNVLTTGNASNTTSPTASTAASSSSSSSDTMLITPSITSQRTLLSFLSEQKRFYKDHGHMHLHDALNNVSSMLSTLYNMKLLSKQTMALDEERMKMENRENMRMTMISSPSSLSAASAANSTSLSSPLDTSSTSEKERSYDTFLHLCTFESYHRHLSLERYDKQLSKVSAALKQVKIHNEYLKSRLEIYQLYLTNVKSLKSGALGAQENVGGGGGGGGNGSGNNNAGSSNTGSGNSSSFSGFTSPTSFFSSISSPSSSHASSPNTSGAYGSIAQMGGGGSAHSLVGVGGLSSNTSSSAASFGTTPNVNGGSSLSPDSQQQQNDAQVTTRTMKYSHSDLINMQLIHSIDPEYLATQDPSLLKNIQYILEMRYTTSSSTVAPRFFLRIHVKKGPSISLLNKPVEIILEDLLKLQEEGVQHVNIEYVKLNVNVLVSFLNKEFMTHIQS